MDQLNYIYPSTLAAWDIRDRPTSDGMPHSAFRALNFARRMNLVQMLPIAFYECCILSPEKFLEGIMWASEECTELPQDDLLKCLTGREKLRHATQFTIFSFAYESSHSVCNNREHCPTYRMEWVRKKSVLPASGWDPLSITVDWGAYHRVCRYCHLLAKDMYESQRKKLWEELPSYFGLPSWANLLGSTT
jgi:hypothetical protein